MVRITSGTQTVEVGPVDEMGPAVDRLRTANYKFKLIGAMGPPNWDSRGGRTDAGSVWCVNGAGVFFPDVLRYDAGTDPPQLTGSVTCFPFPADP